MRSKSLLLKRSRNVRRNRDAERASLTKFQRREERLSEGMSEYASSLTLFHSELSLLDSEFFGEHFPTRINKCLGLVIHLDFLGPRPCKAFTRPFTGCVNAHFRT